MELQGLVPQVELDPASEAERRSRFPAGAAIEFADLEEAGREGALDALRESEPISWVPALGGWLVTSYDAARELLGDRDAFTVWAEPNLVRASLGVMMLTTDGASQLRQRAPFDPPFRLRAVRDRFEAPVRRRVDVLIEDLRSAGGCELGHDFAGPFAVGVAGDILGLSLEDVHAVRRFYEAFAGAMVYDGDPEPQRRADAARAELNVILLGEIARVRAEPDGSVTSAVANEPGHDLTDDEIAAQLRVILFGAVETVESMVLNAILLMLSHPDQLGLVRAEPELLGNAIDEAMRLIPPVAFIERWTRSATTLAGVHLGRGEFLGVSTLAANRDPLVFADPLRFDITRDNARHHLGFSHGAHHCLGFNMARMQGSVAVGALLERLPGAALEHVSAPAGFAFRRPAELRLRWSS
jgi:cytochrome P450